MAFGVFQFRRGTAAQWTAANTVLASGELGLETDTAKFKIGNGTAAWTALPYGGIKGDTGAAGRGITSITRTAGTGAAGTTDTYTITYTDNTASTFNVTNGANGTNGLSVAVSDEGTQLTATASSINFVGAGVTATNTGNAVTVTVPQPISTVFGRTGAITAQDADYAAFYQKLYFIDATRIGISSANTAAANTTAFNTWFATAPVNFTLQFPDGTFDFSAELTLNRNLQGMFKGMGKSRTILRTTSATANLFFLSISAYYYSFEELGFASTVTKTAGAMIGTNGAGTAGTGDNAYLDVRRCEFKNYFVGIGLDGVGAGNVGTISEVLMNSPSANGIGLRINGENINMMVHNCTINHNPGAAGTGICLQVLTSGAVQFTGCDFIGGSKTLEVNPTVRPVSALFFTNCFFDQAASVTVDFIGSQPISRVKFVQCGITNGNVANSTALRIAGTGTGTGIPEALDFEQCDLYNSFAGLACTGVSITGCRGIDIKDCRISGFTVGVDITPFSANGVTNFNLQGNTIGPTENFPGNGTGVRINAGAVTYGPSNISYNDLSGNTTAALVENGNYDNGVLQLVGNLGLVSTGKITSNAAVIATAATATRIGQAAFIPANTAKPGTTVRITGFATNAATINTNTITVRIGAANTNADAAAITLALGAGTAAVGGATIVAELTFITTGAGTAQVIGYVDVINATAAAGFTNAARQQVGGTISTVNTTTPLFIGLYVSPSAANVVTPRHSCIEVVGQ